jgi:hypothetical protein
VVRLGRPAPPGTLGGRSRRGPSGTAGSRKPVARPALRGPRMVRARSRVTARQPRKGTPPQWPRSLDLPKQTSQLGASTSGTGSPRWRRRTVPTRRPPRTFTTTGAAGSEGPPFRRAHRTRAHNDASLRQATSTEGHIWSGDFGCRKPRMVDSRWFRSQCPIRQTSCADPTIGPTPAVHCGQTINERCRNFVPRKKEVRGRDKRNAARTGA